MKTKMKKKMEIKLKIEPCCCCHYYERIIPVRVLRCGTFTKYKFKCDNCGYESDERTGLYRALKRWNQENKNRLNAGGEINYSGCIQADKKDILKFQRW